MQSSPTRPQPYALSRVLHGNALTSLDQADHRHGIKGSCCGSARNDSDAPLPQFVASRLKADACLEEATSEFLQVVASLLKV